MEKMKSDTMTIKNKQSGLGGRSAKIGRFP